MAFIKVLYDGHKKSAMQRMTRIVTEVSVTAKIKSTYIIMLYFTAVRVQKRRERI